jgi:hypothetical protein
VKSIINKHISLPYSENSEGCAFLTVLIFATFFPIVIYFFAVKFPLAFIPSIVAFIGTLSGTHVFATSYLLIQKKELVGVLNPKINLIYIPILIFFTNVIVITSMPLFLVLIFKIFYVHYAMWHFGRQNLGVMAFASSITRKKPMETFERKTIVWAVIAGMGGAYSVFAPALTLNYELFPFDLSIASKFGKLSYYLGLIIYIFLLPLVFRHIIQNIKEYNFFNLSLYLGSVCFFLPIFIFSNPLFTLASYTTAHGFQYLVFLSWHSFYRSKSILKNQDGLEIDKYFLPRRYFFWIPIVFFLASIFLALTIWQTAAGIQTDSNFTFNLIKISQDEKTVFLVKLALSVISGITMVHYWVDQHLWKFTNSDRRLWLMTRFPFLRK